MAYCYEHPHPAVTVDIALLTTRDGDLQVLLIRRANPPFQGRWALPGGFVNPDEDLETAACRELAEETGVSGVSLEQLHAFGAPDRDPRERVITVAYCALVPPDSVSLRPATDAAAVSWISANDLPSLAFDHSDIISIALRRLTNDRTERG